MAGRRASPLLLLVSLLALQPQLSTGGQRIMRGLNNNNSNPSASSMTSNGALFSGKHAFCDCAPNRKRQIALCVGAWVRAAALVAGRAIDRMSSMGTILQHWEHRPMLLAAHNWQQLIAVNGPGRRGDGATWPSPHSPWRLGLAASPVHLTGGALLNYSVALEYAINASNNISDRIVSYYLYTAQLNSTHRFDRPAQQAWDEPSTPRCAHGGAGRRLACTRCARCLGSAPFGPNAAQPSLAQMHCVLGAVSPVFCCPTCSLALAALWVWKLAAAATAQTWTHIHVRQPAQQQQAGLPPCSRSAAAKAAASCSASCSA